ncbi:MAG: hypothetical protein DRQ13_11275 [Ignavibacteriae bacterium]|nr:MAG: hypothetical protein DRQ13_11275 [Ignavibacteriota bacterium]
MNKTLHKIYVGSFFVVGVAVMVLLAINGYDYYSTPLEERFFNSQHTLLKPSGDWGHGFGIIGTLMMILGVSIYMIRKRVKWFFNFGFLKHWLEFHIFLCTVGPMLVLYHTAFKFGGIVSVSFWSMVLVVLSGVIGRFIYVQIPRTIQGQEMGINAMNDMRENLASKVTEAVDFDGKTLDEFKVITSTERYREFSIIKALLFIPNDYFKIRSILRKIKKDLKFAGLPKIVRKNIIKSAKNEIVLARRIGLLRTFHKLFRYWHIAHLPFAITMFVIMLFHVGVTLAFGYKWIF